MTLYLTAVGKQLIINEIADPTEAGINFSSVQLGAGDVTDDGDEVTALRVLKNTMSISGITTDDDFVNITAYLNNGTVNEGYHVTEIGIMVTDPDDATAEVMFAYGYADEDSTMYIPAAGDYALETTMILKVYVGDVENVSASISASLVYASKEYVDDLFNDHITDYTNPHHVTTSQIGAAAEDHTHDISDINGLQTELDTLSSAISNIDVFTGAPDILGFYEGDGSSGAGNYQTITLGFTPSKVVIFPLDKGPYDSSATQGPFVFAPSENLYHSGCGSTYYTSTASAMFARGHGGAAVVTNGFAVQYYSGVNVNTNGEKYMYMAWK